jgi:hypothetical protein
MRRMGTMVLLLSACSLLPTGCAREVRMDEGMSGIRGAYGDAKTWLRAAEGHEAQGDLQRALFEYRLAKTVSRRDAPIVQAIERVQKQIEARTGKLSREAKNAVVQDKRSTARRIYLEILSLQPDNRAALAALRKLEEGDSLRALEKKVALSKHSKTDGRSPVRGTVDYAEEGYAYSRQALLEEAERPSDARQLLQELEKHVERYPQDRELRRLLVETSLGLTEQTYQAEQLDKALSYINKAEQVSQADAKLRQIVADARKRYGRELYNKGVISYRNEPQKALKAWRYALEFDPQDEKSRLRIRAMSPL